MRVGGYGRVCVWGGGECRCGACGRCVCVFVGMYVAFVNVTIFRACIF